MYAAEMNFCCHFQPHFAIFSHSLDVIFKASRPSFVIVFHYGWSLKTRQRLFASFKSTSWSVPPTFLYSDFFIKDKSGTLNIAWLLSWWDYWLAFLMQTRVVRAVATKTNHGLQRLFIFVGEPELFWWRVSIASARRFLISVVYSCVLMAHSTCYFYIMWFPFAMNIHKDLIIL